MKPDRRDARHAAIKIQIRLDARRILQELLAAGALSQQEAKMSDADLETLFQSPEPFLERIASRKRLRDAFAAVATHWWNNILGFHRLHAEAGQFMSGADRGTGLLESGGYDPSKISLVDAARETDDGRVAAANFRPAYWNGGWATTSGVDGHQAYEDDDAEASRAEQERMREDFVDYPE